MSTKFHLSSAQDLDSSILDAIKATFKSKAITIIVEEDYSIIDLDTDFKSVLDERLHEDESTYLTSDESISLLQKKYGI